MLRDAALGRCRPEWQSGVSKTIGGVQLPTPAGLIAATASMGVVQFQPGTSHEFVSVESLMHELNSNISPGPGAIGQQPQGEILFHHQVGP